MREIRKIISTPNYIFQSDLFNNECEMFFLHVCMYMYIFLFSFLLLICVRMDFDRYQKRKKKREREKKKYDNNDKNSRVCES